MTLLHTLFRSVKVTEVMLSGSGGLQVLHSKVGHPKLFSHAAHPPSHGMHLMPLFNAARQVAWLGYLAVYHKTSESAHISIKRQRWLATRVNQPRKKDKVGSGGTSIKRTRNRSLPLICSICCRCCATQLSPSDFHQS